MVCASTAADRTVYPVILQGCQTELHPAEDQGALDLLDRLGDLDAARAGLGAIEGGPAAPDTFAVVEDFQPFVAALVAAVEDEPVGADDRLWPEVLAVVPVDGARRGAGRAEDALRRVVVALPIRWR